MIISAICAGMVITRVIDLAYRGEYKDAMAGVVICGINLWFAVNAP